MKLFSLALYGVIAIASFKHDFIAARLIKLMTAASWPVLSSVLTLFRYSSGGEDGYVRVHVFDQNYKTYKFEY